MRYTVQIEAAVPITEDVLDRVSEALVRHGPQPTMGFTADRSLITAVFEIDSPTVTSACTAAVDAVREILTDATGGCRILSICVTAD